MKQQLGFSLSGFLTVAAILVVASLLAMKLVPPYTEYSTIQRDMTEIVNDPGMANASGPEIREAFSKKTAVDDVKSVSAEDIEIDREPFQLHVKYGVKIPLAANISVYLDFEAKAVKGSK